MATSRPSDILNDLDRSEKRSLAGIVAVSLPADDLADGLWNVTLLEDILVMLDLDKSLSEGFYPMTEHAQLELPPPENLKASWEERVGAFRESLPAMGEPRSIVLRDLMVVVALTCGYDARTRVMFRRVCDAMQIDWHPRVSEVESTLARKVYERVNRERERELKGDRWRGVKIGAAMIGGGALLAVTGGLAAPAFAAGIAASSSLIGASAAATLSGFATTAWMATVFGATGAGLVGYKMDRRTQGVKEFEFESETSVGEEMCVSICVPGVLKDKADLQRGWGVEPRGPDVSARERLRRFYYVYNREKVGDVEEILRAYKGREAKLCKMLYSKYGVDPRDPPTREALAQSEDRPVEGVSQENLARDAEAIGLLMERVLTAEKKEKEKEEKHKDEKPEKGERFKAVTKAIPNFSKKAEDTDEKQPAEAPPLPPRPTDIPGASPASTNVSSTTQRTKEIDTAPPSSTSEQQNLISFDGPVDAPETAFSETVKPDTVESRSMATVGPKPAVSRGVSPPRSIPTDEEGVVFRDWDRIADDAEETLLGGVDGLNIGASPRKNAAASGQSETGSGTADEEIISMVEEEKAKAAMEKYRVWFWQDKLPHTDQYVLRWESDWLVTLGKSVESMIKSLSQSAMQETLKYTTLAAVMTSLSWPLALITLSNVIDADWTIGRERADIAGKILADALLNREQGCRPVTLVGTSLGARLIFSCLEEIARRHDLWEEQMLESGAGNSANDGGAASSRSKLTRMKNAVTPNNKGKSKVGLNGVGVSSTQRNSTSGSGSAASGGARKSSSKVNEARCAAGVIENVCLLGAPLGASAARWERVAKVVHGRIINGYSKSDIILGLVFRAKSLSLSIAGVQKVTAAGVENVDLSSIVGSNHFNYNRRMPEILPLLALDDCSKYIGKGDPQEPDASPSASTSASRSNSTSTSTSSATRDDSENVIVHGTTIVP